MQRRWTWTSLPPPLSIGFSVLLSVGLVSTFVQARGAEAARPTNHKPKTVLTPSTRFPKLSHDLTFRPTVLIRKGNSQGSGTLIATKGGETLILTAAHVARAKEKGPIRVEIHRYNLGFERTRPEEGWPLSVEAQLVAADPVGDVALLKVEKGPRFPFIAKIAEDGEEPKRGAPVLSLGIDGGENLSCWSTRVQETASFAMDADRDGDPELLVNQADRRFLLTAKPPAHGRSGGGLFSDSGELIGVCVGRIAMEKQDRPQGLFASFESVRKLLKENNLEGFVASSETTSVRRRVQPTRASNPRR